MLKIKNVKCMVRDALPKEGENFSTDFKITPYMVSLIIKIDIYFRTAEDCPLNRPNWIIDITLINDQVMCVKLPEKMTLESVEEYISPLKMACLKPGNEKIH